MEKKACVEVGQDGGQVRGGLHTLEDDSGAFSFLGQENGGVAFSDSVSQGSLCPYISLSQPLWPPTVPFLVPTSSPVTSLDIYLYSHFVSFPTCSMTPVTFS